jgi:hypothetical protein
MFSKASTFNQDLCPWQSKIQTSATTYFMFERSSCPEPGIPSLSSVCRSCKKYLPTKAPTEKPVAPFTTRMELQVQVKGYLSIGQVAWANSECDEKRCGDYYG